MKAIIIHSEITIREAMKALNKTGEKCLIVVDDNNKYIGTLTDGDLRRAILSGADFNDKIENSYNSNSISLIEGRFSKNEAREIMAKEEIEFLPIVDINLNVVDYLTVGNLYSGVQKKNQLQISVVIMAGGKGTRMNPFTKILPKPLIPIEEKPIIEHIIEKFTSVGVNNFYITINYKSRILKAFFEELNPDYSVSFVQEQQPLGTAGSLKLLDSKFDKPFLVTNCDTIIDADYADLYKFHKKNSYDITLVACTKTYIIPYGTCELNGDGHLSRINEKPEYNFLVNAGLYVLNPEVLALIPENKLYNMTELIKDAQKKGLKIGVYPIDDDIWIDVGIWTEYKKVVERL